MGKFSLLIAFGVSLSLHLVAFILLSESIHSNTIPSGKSAGVAHRKLIVTIVKPGQPAAIPSPVPPPVPPANQAPYKANNPPLNDTLLPSALVLHEPYYPVSELDVIPEIKQEIELYPEALQAHKQGGKVVLRLWIDEFGQVEKVELVKSELPPIFVEVATRNFMRASFSPGRKNNLPVKSKIDAVLVFPDQDIGS